MVGCIPQSFRMGAGHREEHTCEHRVGRLLRGLLRSAPTLGSEYQNWMDLLDTQRALERALLREDVHLV